MTTEKKYPVKECDYCDHVGMAYTTMAGETICKSCLSDLPTDAAECRKLIVEQRKRIAELEKYNLGLATESHELQQKLEAAEQRIVELEKNQLPDGYITVPADAWHELCQQEKRADDAESLLVEVTKGATGKSPCARYCEALAAKKAIEQANRERDLAINRAEIAERDLKNAENRVDAYKLHVDEMRETQFRRFNNEECWIYQGDGEDYPESLIFPVVISAEQLRTFLAAERERDENISIIDAISNGLSKDPAALCKGVMIARKDTLNKFAIEQQIKAIGEATKYCVSKYPNGAIHSLGEFAGQLRQQLNGGE